MNIALFLTGLALTSVAIILAFRDKAANQSTMGIVLGVACCFAGAGFLPTLKAPGGVEASVKVIDSKIETTKADVNAALAPINLSLEKLKKFDLAQADTNDALVKRIDALIASTRSTLPNLPMPINPMRENNQFNIYSILIFYRDQRESDALKLVRALTAKGFKASAINSSLAEVQIETQPNGTTYIIPTTSLSADATKSVDDIARSTLSGSNVKLGGNYQLRRGDAQIYLY